MRYKIFKDGEQINTIIADAEFAEHYCADNGYTYEEEILSEPEPEPTDEPTTDELMDILLGVSTDE